MQRLFESCCPAERTGQEIELTTSLLPRTQKQPVRPKTLLEIEESLAVPQGSSQACCLFGLFKALLWRSSGDVEAKAIARHAERDEAISIG